MMKAQEAGLEGHSRGQALATVNQSRLNGLKA
jgi:hypothetical protein